jgi:hypothetical protein
MIALHYIIEDKFDMRGIKHGWTLMNALDMPDSQGSGSIGLLTNSFPRKPSTFQIRQFF